MIENFEEKCTKVVILIDLAVLCQTCHRKNKKLRGDQGNKKCLNDHRNTFCFLGHTLILDFYDDKFGKNAKIDKNDNLRALFFKNVNH